LTIDGSIEIGEGVHWGGHYEKVKSLINNFSITSSQIRFFLGYSGWAGGQLQAEIDENVWIATNVGHHLIFNTEPENLWREILRNMGGKYKEMANYPIDPRLN
jgi:putative transcriptional regulator